MKIINTLSTWLYCAGCLSTLFLSFPVGADNTITISAEHAANLGVAFGRLTPVSQIPLLTAPATIIVPPAQEHVISAPQAGLITKLNVAVGDTVKKGQVLAQLNSPDLLALQGRYLKAASVFSLANANYQRDRKLLQEGVIANRREQESLSQYHAAELDRNEAQQLLHIAGMSAADIQLLQDKHQLTSEFFIRAPIAGVVLERLAVLGTRIDMLAPLYKIANLNELWLEIAVPQEKIGSLKLGDTVLIQQTATQAVISQLGQSVTPENQTLQARAVITGAQAGIRVGQRVNIQINQAIASSAYQVPNNAIAQNEGKAYVFLHTPMGFKVSPVVIIGKAADSTIIQGDFRGDEELAIKGAVALKANWLGLGSEE